MSLSNTAANLLIRSSGIGVQLMLVPIAVTTLGKDTYGLWMTAMSLALIASALDLGAMNAVFNISARKRFQLGANLCAVAASRRTLFIVSGLLILLAIVSYSFDVAQLLNTQQPKNSTRALILLVCTISLLTLPFSVFNQLRLGRLEAARIAPALVLGNLGGLVAAWIVSQVSNSPFAFIAAALLPAFLAQVTTALLGFARYTRLPVRCLTAPLICANHRIRAEGSPFFVVQVATLGSFHIDNLIIATMLTSARAAEYSLANRFFSIISIVLSVFLATSWPLYAKLAHNQNSGRLHDAFKRNLLLSVGFAAASALILYALRGTFFQHWTRGTVRPESDLMIALGLFAVVNAAIGNISAVLNATNNIRIQAIVAVAMLLPNVLLSVLLVRQFGPVGTVSASIICAMTMLCIYFWYLKKFRKLR